MPLGTTTLVNENVEGSNVAPQDVLDGRVVELAVFFTSGSLAGTTCPVRGFAEAHKGFNSEPTHIEDEVEDQEDEVEDGRDCEECKERVEEREREIKHTDAVTHGWYDAH